MGGTFKASVDLLVCWVTVGWSKRICIYSHGKCSFQFTCPGCFGVVEGNRKSSHQNENKKHFVHYLSSWAGGVENYNVSVNVYFWRMNVRSLPAPFRGASIDRWGFSCMQMFLASHQVSKVNVYYCIFHGVSCTQEQTSLFVRYMKIIGKLIHVCFNKLRLTARIVWVHLLLEIQVNVNS